MPLSPYQVLLTLGPDALTDTELVLVASDLRHPERARRALDLLGGIEGVVSAPAADLQAAGVSASSAVRLLAAFGLLRRAQHPPGRRLSIGSAADVHDLVAPSLVHLDHEELVLLCLDRRNGVRHMRTVSVGSRSHTIVDPTSVFRVALLHRAASVIVVHNHPSGDPRPSADDLSVTKRLAEAGRSLGVLLLDHVVVAREGYRSLAEMVGLPGQWAPVGWIASGSS